MTSPQLGGSFLYEPEDMVDCGGEGEGGEEGEGVDGGGGKRGGEQRRKVECKLSSLAQTTLRKVFEDIVSC